MLGLMKSDLLIILMVFSSAVHISNTENLAPSYFFQLLEVPLICDNDFYFSPHGIYSIVLMLKVVYPVLLHLCLLLISSRVG